MSRKTVTVFGASGRQGLAQVRQLLAQGFEVRAISRNPAQFNEQNIENLIGTSANYNDLASLTQACEGADAVFFTHPMFEDAIHVNDHISRVGKAAKQAGIKRLVYNTSSWVPDEPCGQIAYDTNLQRENLFAAADVPLTCIRPVLFMDNLLTDWVKPGLADKGLYQYPHAPTMAANWISLDDVAKFMIAAIEREDLAGERIVIGGPEALKPEQVATALSNAMGKDITFDYITPRQFGERMYGLFGDVSPLDEETYAASMDDFYSWINDNNGVSFRVDMEPVLARIPIELTTL
ncbi:MAG: SDR family oxidoreductase, partial [Halioglobus sp.]